MNCNEINRNQRDERLCFDEAEHRYTLAGRELKSVTTLVDEYFPDFDAPYWAARKAPALGIEPEELIRRWEENARRARELGTQMHARIESYYLGCDDVADDTDAMRLFKQFTKVYHLNPYRTEWRVYHEEFNVAGTLDFLDLTDGVFTIWDWKRSCKLIDRNGNSIQPHRFTASCLHPSLRHIPDMSYFHYALQLSIYRLILEEKYGIIASGQRLGIFHPDYRRHYVMDVPYLRLEAETLLRANAQASRHSSHQATIMNVRQ